MIPSVGIGELIFSSGHLPLPLVLEYEPDRLILDAPPWDGQPATSCLVAPSSYFGLSLDSLRQQSI